MFNIDRGRHCSFIKEMCFQKCVEVNKITLLKAWVIYHMVSCCQLHKKMVQCSRGCVFCQLIPKANEFAAQSCPRLNWHCRSHGIRGLSFKFIVRVVMPSHCMIEHAVMSCKGMSLGHISFSRSVMTVLPGLLIIGSWSIMTIRCWCKRFHT